MFDASKLLNQMFGAGGANNPLGQIGGMLGGLTVLMLVVLLAGSAHVDRTLGVPLHLPPTLKAKAVRLWAAWSAIFWKRSTLLSGRVPAPDDA